MRDSVTALLNECGVRYETDPLFHRRVRQALEIARDAGLVDWDEFSDLNNLWKAMCVVVLVAEMPEKGLFTPSADPAVIAVTASENARAAQRERRLRQA